MRWAYNQVARDLPQRQTVTVLVAEAFQQLVHGVVTAASHERAARRAALDPQRQSGVGRSNGHEPCVRPPHAHRQTVDTLLGGGVRLVGATAAEPLRQIARRV